MPRRAQDETSEERAKRPSRGRDDEDETQLRISLGWLVHACSASRPRTRLRRGCSARRARRRLPRGEPDLTATRSSRASTAEPRCRDADDEDEEDETTSPPHAPRASRAQRAAPKPRRSSGGYELAAARVCWPRRASRATAPRPANEMISENATALEGVLGDFGVRGEIINARPGPVVTLYELEPAPGIKSSRVIGLADDIARSMSALSARVAVVSGRNAIGIELPNANAREGLSARAARLATIIRATRPSCRSASARPSAASR